MKIETLLFDFGGTLDSDGVAWKDRFEALFRVEGFAPEAGFDRAFYDADDALVGTLPREMPLPQTVERLSGDVARALGADAAAGSRVARKFLDESLARLAESARLFETLSQRYRLGIVSNFYGNLEAVCAGVGIGAHLGVAVDSAAVGFEKPDPRIFQAALSALDARPESTLFVGDSLPRDMRGAKAIGMPHVWLKPGEKEACCPEDVVIGSLGELPGVIR